MSSSTDRIVRTIDLKAPQDRVWRALTDSRQFGAWFGITLGEPFTPGRVSRGTLTMRGQQLAIEFTVERIRPETEFAYRWHPYAIDPKMDYSSEPMTLVEFHLRTVAEGTELTVIESGFDRIPSHRRDEAYRMNDGGWKSQVENLRRYVTGG